MYRRHLVAALLVTAATASLVVNNHSVAFADTVTVLAAADAYVQADKPAVNFGSSTELHADASPVTNSYVKFQVSGLTAAPTKVTLRIYTRSAGTTSVKVQAVSDSSWTESELTYATAPPLGAAVGNSGTLTANTYFAIDVTSTVTGNGTYSFAASTGSTAVRILDSKEGANPPQLVVERTTTTTPPPTTTTTPPPPTDPVVLAAGDVACAPTESGYNGGAGIPGQCHMKATSDILMGTPASTVMMLGDSQYNSGALADLQTSYGASWGRVLANTRPTVGNHEYGQSGAGGYFSYFQDAATPQQPGCRKNCWGYYSYDVGNWHIAVINTECTRIGSGVGCAVGSPQEQWLNADLAAHASGCTMVVGHRPRWSSNSFASSDIAPLIDVMYARGVDVMLTGHAHSYERFAPQNAAGQRDDAAGIREFVVGTGGENYSGFGTVVANSEVRKNQIFGVFKLVLHPGRFDWSFVPDPATPFADSGSQACH
jgi:hypothetical protein